MSYCGQLVCDRVRRNDKGTARSGVRPEVGISMPVSMVAANRPNAIAVTTSNAQPSRDILKPMQLLMAVSVRLPLTFIGLKIDFRVFLEHHVNPLPRLIIYQPPFMAGARSVLR
jgi:hypothetical protein